MRGVSIFCPFLEILIILQKYESYFIQDLGSLIEQTYLKQNLSIQEHYSIKQEDNNFGQGDWVKIDLLKDLIKIEIIIFALFKPVKLQVLMTKTSKLGLLVLIITCCLSAIHQPSKQSFSIAFGVDWESFASASRELSHQHFILFYKPQVESSLELRDNLLNIVQQYQRRLIQMLKKRGYTQFQQFQSYLEKLMQISQVDCGQNVEICSFFSIVSYPTIVYLGKNMAAYQFKPSMNSNEIFNFISKSEQNRVDSRTLKSLQLQFKTTSLLSSIIHNEFFMYIVAFLVFPFLFGYFVMGKQNKGSTLPEKPVGKISEKKKN